MNAFARLVKRMPRHLAAVVNMDLVQTEADLFAHVCGAIDDQATKTVFPGWTRKQMHAAKMFCADVHIAMIEGETTR